MSPRRTVGNLLLSVILLTTAAAAVDAQPDKGKLLKAVVVSRHGVRTPLESFDDLNKWTLRTGGWPQVWNPPDWPASDKGDLTKVGFDLAALMGRYYHSRFVGDGLFVKGRCPAANAVFLRADVTERTQATGQAIATGFAKGILGACPIDVTVLQGAKNDPLFHPTSDGAVCPLGAAQAQASILARLPPGGFAEIDKRHRPAITEMQDALQCCQPTLCKDAAGNAATCQLTDLPTQVTVSGDKVKMEGAIDIASTASEIFLLEYANGLLARDVGWGVVDVPKMTRLLTLHNLQFDYMQRTKYIARRQGSMLLRAVLESLQGGPYSGTMAGPMPAADAKFVAFVGHDTNVANLGAMLDTSWTASERLPDKTAPAGALLFELREYGGVRYVVAYYVAETVSDMRERRLIDRAKPPHIAALPLPCATTPGGNTCKLVTSSARPAGPSFQGMVNGALEPLCLK